MRNLFRRRPVASFYVLALAIGILANVLRAVHGFDIMALFAEMNAGHMHMNVITGFEMTAKYPLAYTLILFPAAPTIAALIVTGVAYGRAGYAELFSRVRPWRAPVGWRQGVLVLGICWLTFVAVSGMLWTSTFMWGPPGAMADAMARFGGTPLAVLGMLLVSLLISSGPFFEELGWRGFALPHLLRHFDPLNAAIILGTLWWAWHFPRDVPMLVSGKPGAVTAVFLKQLVILPPFIAGTVICVFLFNKLGGSMWGGLMAHGFHNELATNVAAYWSPRFLGSGWRVIDVIEMTIGLILVLVFGRNLGADTSPDSRLAWGNTPPVTAEPETKPATA